jgi:hypothetical protein
MIRQTAANDDALLQTKAQMLRQESALLKEKGDAPALARARANDEAIATIEAQREAVQVIANAKITSERAVSDLAFQQRIAQSVAQIQIENGTELDMLQAKLVERQNIIDLAYDAGLISDDQYGVQSILIFSAGEKEKTRIQDEETKKRFGIAKVYRQLDLESTGAFLGMMSQLMESHSRAAFNIGKAAAISKTIIDTYQAAQGAYAALSSIYLVGPFLGAAAAAAAIAAGLARVQQIRSTQFGSSGGAVGTYSASPTTGVPTAPVGPPQAPAIPQTSSKSQIVVNVTVNGSVVGGGGMQQIVQDEVVPALKDLIDNRDVVIIGANSRQAATITG